jgi:hypothetical protein
VDRQHDVTTRRRSTIKAEATAKLPLNREPVSGFEPLASRLQEVRPRAPSALAAPMTQVIALTAPAALGFSGATFHEPFHADGGRRPMAVTERSDLTAEQRCNLTTRSTGQSNRSLRYRIGPYFDQARRLRRSRPGVSARAAVERPARRTAGHMRKSGAEQRG